MKGIIPAAGLGTRFLPATKASPKEMLPVVDKPTIQYVIEEALESGITDIVIITGRGKRAIEDHFDRSFELEAMLHEKGKTELLEASRAPARGADIFYIRQKQQRGLGHAIGCAKRHVGKEPFAVLLGDDIIVNGKPCIGQLIEVHERLNASVIAVERVPRDRIDAYGVIKPREIEPGLYEVEDIVEKPRPDAAPSDLAVIGRYVLMPEIFDCIEETDAGTGGEIQLTDALHLLNFKQKIYALEFKGTRYDIGSKLDWLRANIALGLQREEFGKELKEYIKSICE